MIIDDLATSFATLTTEQAIDVITHLISLLEGDDVNQKWLFSVIAAVAAAQTARRTPQLQEPRHLQLVASNDTP